jgi:hypothetical protein
METETCKLLRRCVFDPHHYPSYFASEPCRGELKQFVDRENATGFKELILPIYYIDTPQLKDQFEKATDLLAQTVAEHHYIDITKLRHRSITSYEPKQEIKKLATALFERLRFSDSYSRPEEGHLLTQYDL